MQYNTAAIAGWRARDVGQWRGDLDLRPGKHTGVLQDPVGRSFLPCLGTEPTCMQRIMTAAGGRA